MRAVVQRVKKAKVEIEGQVCGKIEQGLMVLLAVHKNDTEEDLDYIYNKIIGLRIFEDDQGKINLDLSQVGGSLLVVSQFTLYGDARKGRRPSFTESAKADLGDKLYSNFIERAKVDGIDCQSGKFGADMDVSLINQGPVTILLDSSKIF